MKYGHVGRPTNEEVAAKKRKKVMIVVLPMIAIIAIVGVVISKGGLDGMMGNSFDYSKCRPCDKSNGWNDGENNTCYKDTTETDQVDAILIGDVDNDGEVTLKDYTLIKNSVENNEQLTDEQKLVYDLNSDGVVNQDDVSGYSTGTTGQFSFQNKYACPNPKIDQSKTNDGEIIKTYEYKYNEVDNKCDLTVSIREIKNAVCDLDSKSMENKEESNNEIPDIEMIESCDGKICNKTIPNVPDINSADITPSDEVSYLNVKSNLLNYSSGSGKFVVRLYFVNKNSSAREGLVLIEHPVTFALYSDKNCKRKIREYNSKFYGETFNVYVNQNYVSAGLNTYHGELKFNKSENGKVYYVKQLTSMQGYQSNNKCKKFTVKKDGEVIFKNTPLDSNKYVYVTIDGKNFSAENRIKVYESDKAIVHNMAKKSGKRFVGWRVKRSQDKKYLCYTGRNSTKTKWDKSCKYYVLIASGGTINSKISQLKKGSTMQLISYWVKS